MNSSHFLPCSLQSALAAASDTIKNAHPVSYNAGTTCSLPPLPCIPILIKQLIFAVEHVVAFSIVSSNSAPKNSKSAPSFNAFCSALDLPPRSLISLSLTFLLLNHMHSSLMFAFSNCSCEPCGEEQSIAICTSSVCSLLVVIFVFFLFTVSSLFLFPFLNEYCSYALFLTAFI